MPTIKTQFGRINLGEPDQQAIKERQIEMLLKLAQLQQLRNVPAQQDRQMSLEENKLAQDTELRRASLTQNEKEHLTQKDLAEKNLALEAQYKGSLMENLVAERGLKAEDQNITKRGQDIQATNSLVGTLAGTGENPKVLADVLASHGDPSYKSALTANAPVDPITEALKKKLGGSSLAGQTPTPSPSPTASPTASPLPQIPGIDDETLAQIMLLLKKKKTP